MRKNNLERNMMTSNLNATAQANPFCAYNDLLQTGKKNLFLAKVSGDSMLGSGINDADIMIIESKNKANSGDIILAEINGHITVKRYEKSGQVQFLIPENPIYPIIEIQNSDNFLIRGKICGVIRKY